MRSDRGDKAASVSLSAYRIIYCVHTWFAAFPTGALAQVQAPAIAPPPPPPPYTVRSVQPTLRLPPSPGPTDQCRQSYCTESVLEAVRPLLEDRLTQTERTYIDGTDARTEWVFVWYSEPTDRMDIQGCRTRGQPPLPPPPKKKKKKKIKY